MTARINSRLPSRAGYTKPGQKQPDAPVLDRLGLPGAHCGRSVDGNAALPAQPAQPKKQAESGPAVGGLSRGRVLGRCLSRCPRAQSCGGCSCGRAPLQRLRSPPCVVPLLPADFKPFSTTEGLVCVYGACSYTGTHPRTHRCWRGERGRRQARVAGDCLVHGSVVCLCEGRSRCCWRR